MVLLAGEDGEAYAGTGIGWDVGIHGA
uniref:Uncharacterized protein n=1 Tax=Pseudomonas aeruginosa TaxID=287 RepID=Q9APU0_PSEAI|nr:hypothetical protein [Pseudomonas aeruginosa]